MSNKTRASQNKKKAKVTYDQGEPVSDKETDFGSGWQVYAGRLKPAPGRPSKQKQLFRVVAEKIPLATLADVKAHYELNHELDPYGVYMLHDSMGNPRYTGRGRVFPRIKRRWKENPHELLYFSFYILENKQHEREIETLLIRATGSLLHFNTQKKQTDTSTGRISDYEPGTHFYHRHDYTNA